MRLSGTIDGLISSGLFAQALRYLEPRLDSRSATDAALFAELLYRGGRFSEAKATALKAIELGKGRDDLRALAFETLGLVEKEVGNQKAAGEYFRKAISHATATQDLRRVCRAQLAALPTLIDAGGVQLSMSAAIEARRNVLKTGQPQYFATLHLRYAYLEARRGAYDLAERHLAVANETLERAPNSHVAGMARVVGSVVSYWADKPEQAIYEAEQALAIALRDDHYLVKVAALANLAQLNLLCGSIDKAEEYLVRARKIVVDGSVTWRCLMDTGAQLDLRAGNLHVAGEKLRLISGSDSSQPSWPDVEVNLTRLRLLRALGDKAGALQLAERSLALVGGRNEGFLEPLFVLQRADLLAESGRLSEAQQIVGDLIESGRNRSLSVVAEMSRVAGKVLRLLGSRETGDKYAEWGGRVQDGLLTEKVMIEGESPQGTDTREGRVEYPKLRTSTPSVEFIALLSELAPRTDLLGRELSEILGNSEAVDWVRLIRAPQSKDSPDLCLEKVEIVSGSKLTSELLLGAFQGETLTLKVRTKPALSSRLFVAGVMRIARDAVVLNALKRLDKYRTSLWPVDEGLMLEGNVFVAPRMREYLASARRIAPTTLPVLITGETGAGKEIFAREIHDASPRAKRPFAVFVCSAVPRETLDSHLFGHRRGAFTGAIDNFPGVIRANEGGTLLLDEIGEVSPDLQVKLLRFLETGEIHPLGETRPVKVDVRVIAATNQPLDKLLADGRFREDLYYRLNVVRFTLPPLRERREEILPFVDRFLTRECSQLGKPVPNLSDSAIEHLLLYTWPGNVRQLYNEIRRIAATIPPGVPITPDLLAPEIVEERRAALVAALASAPNQVLIRTDQPLQAAIDAVETAMIRHALATSPDLEAAAAKLSITRKGLFLKRQRLGLD